MGVGGGAGTSCGVARWRRGAWSRRWRGAKGDGGDVEAEPANCTTATRTLTLDAAHAVLLHRCGKGRLRAVTYCHKLCADKRSEAEVLYAAPVAPVDEVGQTGDPF